jgi:2-aminoadipate transaminase
MIFQNSDTFFSTKAQSLRPSAIREIHKLLESPGMRSLAGAWPDPAVFQSKEISKIISTLLAECADQTLQYGSTQGYIELRKVLAEQASKNNGIQCTPEQILITAGSAQGMDLACRTFINPGDIVLVGLPSYFGATSTIASHEGRNIGIPVDEDGLRVDLVEEKLESFRKDKLRIKAVYTIPNFQNPTGVTLSLERRKMLLELADRFQFMIFEDDPYGELRFEGEHLPSLAAMDKHGYVIHFRSTSKTFSPGMRVSWAVGHSDIIDKMELAKQVADIASNTLAQFVLLDLIKTGALRRAIQNNIVHYRDKRDLTLRLVEKHFPEQVSWTKPKGGFFIFVTLPNQLNADELLTEALNHKIAFVSGSSFFVNGRGKNTFRLSYSLASDQDIEAAIPILGDLIRKRINQ